MVCILALVVDVGHRAVQQAVVMKLDQDSHGPGRVGVLLAPKFVQICSGLRRNHGG